jgi:copper chaperone CopZ
MPCIHGIDPKENVMSTRTYTVAGMTCNGCVNKVTRAVEAIDGVEDLDVDVSTGALEVVGDVDASAVEAAINEIGYQLVH